MAWVNKRAKKESSMKMLPQATDILFLRQRLERLQRRLSSRLFPAATHVQEGLDPEGKGSKNHKLFV